MTNYNTISIDTRKKSRSSYTPSSEYKLVSNLAMEHYSGKNGPDFSALLSIPLTERIPALLKEYGLQSMYSLITTMLYEYCAAVDLPKNKKLTGGRISLLVFDLMLIAEEDQLSLEDLIVFFEFARQQFYGTFKSVVTDGTILQMLDRYRLQRQKAWMKIMEHKEAEVSLLGPAERIAPEPTPIKQLFEQTARIIPFKKIN